ncbi:MAG TPA: SufD family Fe-S cluster assembly protein, partial [Pyrinomonadaceae bacterium]
MVTELVKSENSYQAAFQTVRDLSPTVAWLELVRGSAMDRFEQLGFPSVRDEEWKYTNLASLAKESFIPAVRGGEIAVADVSRFAYRETAGAHLVVVNGFLREDLSVTTGLESVVATDLFSAAADARYNKLVRKYLARNAGYDNNGLTALNTAFLQSGVFLWIPRDVKLETPLQITFVADAENSATFPRLLVVAEENSSATVIESFVSNGEPRYFTNAVTEIVLRDGAQLEHYRLQRESKHAFHISTTSAELGGASRYDTTSINLGAQLSRHDISVVLDHEGAETSVDGLYMVGADQHT